MASQTEIVNAGLALLGRPEVSNPDLSGEDRAKIMRNIYALTRDALLASWPWRFATRRRVLPVDGNKPVWGYSSQHRLQADILGILDVRDQANRQVTDWLSEGDEQSNLIVSNCSGTLHVKVTVRVDSAPRFTPEFAQCLSSALALRTMRRLRGSDNQAAQHLERLHRQDLAEAKMIGGRNRPVKRVERDIAGEARHR